MVELETVLVLGAGASKDFGFPVGKELVTQITKMLGGSGGFSKFFQECADRLNLNPDTASRFPSVLQRADPLSVDAWLEHNPTFVKVGKLAIAIILLWYERLKSNLRPTDNWYQLLLKRLDCPFEKFQANRLSIITFNYDRSLEEYLFTAFRKTHSEKGEQECKDKLNELRILHVYGSLGRLAWQRGDAVNWIPEVPFGAKPDVTNWVVCASQGIKIVPEESSELPKEFQDARKLMDKAKALYFLGFGYDPTNMERLGIETLKKPEKVMGTSLGLSYQRTREVERLGIRSFQRTRGLFQEPVYGFLHNRVDFNETGYPPIPVPPAQVQER